MSSNDCEETIYSAEFAMGAAVPPNEETGYRLANRPPAQKAPTKKSVTICFLGV